MATYGYIRVSTARQADEGESLGAQERTLAGYALMHGLTLDHVFIERGVSGSRPLAERPEGAKLLARIKSGDTIITPKLDRLFRSALDALKTLETIKRQGVALHMIDLGGDVTGDGISKLVFMILSAVAEAERDRTRERIAEVKRDQRQRGRYLGGRVPLGYRLESGELVEEPAERAAIKRMKQLRASGQSLRATVQAIKDELGIVISHETVRAIGGPIRQKGTER